MSKGDGGWILPQVIDPPRKCFTLEIPDEPMHRAAFFGVLESLTYWWNWQRDDDHTAAEVTRVWRDVLERAFAGDINCDEGTLQLVNYCREYYPRAPFISFAPTSPFVDEPQVPPGWLQRPWFLPDGVEEGYIADMLTNWAIDILQFWDSYETSDVLTFILSLPLSWLALVEVTGFPRFEVRVEGTGTLELHMINVPLGGRALITVDSPPYEGILSDPIAFIQSLGSALVLDTNLDFTSLPPETDNVDVHEIELTTPGEHVIYVTFVPVLNDELIFFNQGGGLRKVVLCGENLRPIFPPGREGEGEIIVVDPCGCDGLEALVKRIGLSLAYGMNVDLTDGDIVDGEIVPGDDGGTGSDLGYTAQQLVGGGSYGLVRGLRDFYLNLWNWDANGLTPEEMWPIVNQAYKMTDSDAVLAALNVWFADVAHSDIGTFINANLDAFAERVFCDGSRTGIVFAFADLITGASAREDALVMLAVISDEQLADWYEQGTAQPINNPAMFPCYINPPVMLEIQDGAALVAALNGNSIYNIGSPYDGVPQPRKLSIRAEGSFTWPDGYVRDLFYRVNGHSDGSIEEAAVEGEFVAGDSILPADGYVPSYNPLHIYVWTVEIASGVNNDVRLWPEESEPREDDAGITGSMTFTFTDLGEA